LEFRDISRVSEAITAKRIGLVVCAKAFTFCAQYTFRFMAYRPNVAVNRQFSTGPAVKKLLFHTPLYWEHART